MNSSWWILLVAGLFEVAWALGLKASQGMTRPWITAATIVAMLISFILLGLAVRSIPLGTGYAVWTGIGVIGTVIAGVALFNEPLTVVRLLFLALIVAGIVGLKLTTE